MTTGSAYLCSMDGNIVGDQAQHTAWHNYLQERHTDAEADLRVQLDQARAQLADLGNVELQQARVRLIKAYIEHRFVTGDDDETFTELEAATTAWMELENQG